MADRTDPSDRPTARGPWAEVTELNQFFDHGAPWCINADGHPGYDYPDPEIHVPASECRAVGLSLDARTDLAGRPRVLEAYVAQPFRFGEQRDSREADSARLLFDFVDDDMESSMRFSISLGDGLRLARHVLRLIDLVDRPPNL